MSQNESSLPQIPQKSLSELLSEESKSHSPELQFEIAMHYLEGIGTKKSISNAFKFFMIAARHGIRESMVTLKNLENNSYAALAAASEPASPKSFENVNVYISELNRDFSYFMTNDEKLLEVNIAESGLEMSVLSVFRPNLALADEVVEKMVELGTCWSFTKENKIVNFYIEGGMPLICKLDEKS